MELVPSEELGKPETKPPTTWPLEEAPEIIQQEQGQDSARTTLSLECSEASEEMNNQKTQNYIRKDLP